MQHLLTSGLHMSIVLLVRTLFLSHRPQVPNGHEPRMLGSGPEQHSFCGFGVGNSLDEELKEATDPTDPH